MKRAAQAPQPSPKPASTVAETAAPAAPSTEVASISAPAAAVPAVPATPLRAPAPGDAGAGGAPGMAPMPGAMASMGEDSGFIARPGAAAAPVSTVPASRVNTAALAALSRSGDEGANVYASAPRPSFGGAQPTEATAALTPGFGGDADPRARSTIRSSLSRPSPSQMASLEPGGVDGRPQALAAVTGIRMPARAPAAQEAGLPAIAAPGGADLAPGGPQSPAAPGAPGAQLASLNPPSGPGALPGMSAPAPGAVAPAPSFAAPSFQAPGVAAGAPLAAPSLGAPGFGAAPDSGFSGPNLAAPRGTGVSPFAPGRGGASAPAAPFGGAADPGLSSVARAPLGAPAPAERVAALSPASASPVRSIGMAPMVPGLALPGSAATTPAARPVATQPLSDDEEERVSDDPAETDAALRAAVREAVGVPLPRPRPTAEDLAVAAAQAEAETPVRRVDVTPVPIRRTGAVPVRRVGVVQPSAGARETATPVYSASSSATPVQRVGDGEVAPNTATPVVLGPGRLDNRRASSLVAAISTRPGAGVAAPRIVSAPGLSGGLASHDAGAQQGWSGGAQSSAPRPSFGMAAPTLGGGGGGPQIADQAPITVASRSNSGVVRFGGGSPAAPSLGGLPQIGGAPSAPGRESAPGGVDLAPTGPALASPGLPQIGGASPSAPQIGVSVNAPAPVVPVADGPLVALVLHGVDPAAAARPDGPLAPLFGARARVTLVASPGYMPQAAVVAQLKALGVDLVVQAASRQDVREAAKIGAAAVEPISDGRPMSMSAMRRYLAEVKDDGLAIFSPAAGIGPAQRMAENMGLPVIVSTQFVEIRNEANLTVLHSALDRAAFQARQGNGAALELWATPGTVAAAAEWFAAAHSGAATSASLSGLVEAMR